MLKKVTTLILFPCLSLCLSIQSLITDIEVEPEKAAIEEHIEVGSKALDPQEEELLRDRRIKDHETENAAHLRSPFKRAYFSPNPSTPSFTLVLS